MRRSVKNTLRAGALCLILLACALFTTALAAEGDVTYVEYSWDESSSTLTSTTKTLESEYTSVTSSTIAWNEGWYVVRGEVSIGSRVTVNGDVHLILADGCKLTVAGITVNSGNSLTIYGQEDGDGKLISQAVNLDGAGIGGKYVGGSTADNHSGKITVHGGDITAIGSHGAGIGGAMSQGNSGTISIYNCTVTAEGHGGAGIGSGFNGTCGDVYIYGGNVTATSYSIMPAIGSNYNTSGNIYIYGGTVKASNNGSNAINVGSNSNAGLITGDNGRAVIFTNGIRAGNFDPNSVNNPQTGVIFIGSEGKVYGDVTLGNDLSIPTNYTLTVPDSSELTIDNGQTLTVVSGATLAVKGGVTLEETGKLIVEEGGTLAYYIGADIDLSKVDLKGALTFPEMGTGTGTEDDPYRISTADGLRALASIVDGGYDFSGKTVVLDEDIDLNGGGSNRWTPIGSFGSDETNKLPFNGTFDGGGHTISGLYIDTEESFAGLFAYIGENGKVQNLAVSGTVNAKANSGGIAAYNYGTISNCYADVDVTIKLSYAGGVAGNSGGVVKNCYNLGNIQGNSCVAGIVGSRIGSSENFEIKNCYNIGKVSGNSEGSTGAILGYNNLEASPEVNGCYYLDGCVTNGNSYGEFLTAAQFADSESFYSWDFINTWVMSAELGRPVLRSVPEGSEYLIDYVNEKATGLTVYEISTNQAWWSSGTSIPVTPGGTLYVRRVGSEDILETVKLPARPAAPALAINSATQSVTVGDTLEYSFDQTEWTSGTGKAVPVGAGDTIYIRYKASQEEEKFSSGIQTLTAPGGAPAPGTPEIDYTGETVGTEAGMQYRLSETGPWTACTADMPAADFGWDGTAPVTVYFRADPGEGYPGEPVALTIPARPAAPVVKGGAGRIAGATTAMEYSSDGVNWTRFTDETLGRMEPGDYQVRYAATESSFRSEAVPVTVAAGGQGVNVPETYGIELIAGEGGEARTNFTNASAGTKITVTATPDEGYELAYITVDGERISGASFTMPDHDVTVRVYFTDAAAPAFVDVDSADWFYGYVQYVARNGLMEGTGEGRFDPDGTMTRAMFWAVLARIDGETITGDGWKTLAQNWAVSSGISDGTSADALITREQMVTMFYRYAGSPVTGGMAISEFTDGASVSDYATDAVTWALSESILTGMGDGILAPQGTATRAQAAAMLMRFVER